MGDPSKPRRAAVKRGEMIEVIRHRTTIEGDFYRKWRPLGVCEVCGKALKGGHGVRIIAPKEGPAYLRASPRVVHEEC